MRRFAIVLVCVAALLAGASARAADAQDAAPGVAADVRIIDAKIAALTLRERVSQLMLVTLDGLFGPSNDDRTLLKEYPPGGVIIPALVKPELAADYVLALRSAPIERQKGVPLFIGADLYSLARQEGHVAPPFAQLPTLLSIAASGDADAVRQLAGVMASHLNGLGLNLNVGPCLELAPTLPEAPPTLATFGRDAAFAGAAGRALTEALLAEGVLVMPVGFPGGGSNRRARSPAVLLTPRERLMQEDLLPYAAALEAGAPLLHVANTIAPTLGGPAQPASLSSAVMQDLLRTQMGYKGVIVAGPMNGPDIEHFCDSAQAAILALRAGADMLYWDGGAAASTRAVAALEKAVQQGVLPEETIAAALRRIFAVKRTSRIGMRPLPQAKTAAALGAKRTYPREAYAIERRSVTLLQNRNGILPLAKPRSFPVGVTGVLGVEELRNALEKHIKPVMAQPIRTARHLGEIEDFETTRVASRVANGGTVVCVFGGLRRPDGQVRMVRELKKNRVGVVVVLLGHPEHAPYLLEADAIVVSYCDTANCGQSLRAVADALAGAAPARLNLPEAPVTAVAGTALALRVSDFVQTPAGRLPVSLGDGLPAGYAVSYDAGAVLKKVSWEFSDGERVKAPEAVHTFKTPGPYTVTITVTDRDGIETSGAFPVKVE